MLADIKPIIFEPPNTGIDGQTGHFRQVPLRNLELYLLLTAIFICSVVTIEMGGKITADRKLEPSKSLP
ncbi:MAG TPA: hypothetical protein VKS24_23605 [Bradyrhizobium sp.]|nr:hypothetical protein [Bradyrhizobium sp.]